jgi:hypothetical protein
MAEKQVGLAAPIVVECKICGERIELREDTAELRASGEDPAQQLRRHLDNHPLEDAMRIGRWAGWLIDRLAFRAVQNDEAWMRSLSELVAVMSTATPEEPEWQPPHERESN